MNSITVEFATQAGQHVRMKVESGTTGEMLAHQPWPQQRRESFQEVFGPASGALNIVMYVGRAREDGSLAWDEENAKSMFYHGTMYDLTLGELPHFAEFRLKIDQGVCHWNASTTDAEPAPPPVQAPSAAEPAAALGVEALEDFEEVCEYLLKITHEPTDNCGFVPRSIPDYWFADLAWGALHELAQRLGPEFHNRFVRWETDGNVSTDDSYESCLFCEQGIM